MARSKHVHKFIRIGLKNNTSMIWKCALSDCTWFVHLGLAHLMLGKPSICWGCDEMFIMDEASMRDDMPKCVDCRVPIVAVPVVTPIVTPNKPVRTPEQQRLYEKEMREMFGPNWKPIN